MDYHIFSKSVSGKNGKIVKRYYYWYKDGNIQRQKVCKDCKTKADAMAFISKLPPIKQKSTLVKNIAKNMYIPGSEHIKRREQLGHFIAENTLRNGRRYINFIIEKWGNFDIDDITVENVVGYLFTLKKSGSWKSRYISIFGEIFDEAAWYGVKVTRPNFPSFAQNSKKKDILSAEELRKLFVQKNFEDFFIDSETLYLLFLCCAVAGLRLGEAIALQPRQFIFEKKALVIDGFCKPNGQRTNFNKKGSVTNTKARVVLLPEAVIKKVQNYIQERNIQTNDFLFTNNFRPIREWTLEKIFFRALIKAEINVGSRKLTPHSLRYTYVTQMRRTLPGDVVRQLVGHTSLAMTDYYTRFSLENGLKYAAGTDSAVEHLFD